MSERTPIPLEIIEEVVKGRYDGGTDTIQKAVFAENGAVEILDNLRQTFTASAANIDAAPVAAIKLGHDLVA